jgi:hypothetical protein
MEEFTKTNFEAEPEFLNSEAQENRFQGTKSASLCSLAGRHGNPIPARFLAPIDCLKIPALDSGFFLNMVCFYFSIIPFTSDWRSQTLRLNSRIYNTPDMQNCIEMLNILLQHKTF